MSDEITRLGLQYNLLTAYTSFVAVDSRVRTGEKATPVKQPLPLPQGVADSAVGGVARTLAAAPSPSRESLEKRLNQKIERQLKARLGASMNATEETDADKPDASSVRVTISKEAITVSGRLTPSDIEEVLRRHLQDIEDCAARLLSRDPTFRGGKATLILTIDPNGAITAAVAQGELGATPMGTCLTDLTGKWRFPKPTDGNVAMATVVLEVSVGRR